MGNVIIAGTAKTRGLKSVDPRLVQIVQAAAARSPYDVQIFSGQRVGSKAGSRHNSGNALDIALIDPTTGQVIPNYKSSTGFPIYAEFAKVAREEQMAIAPDMADQFRWGGGFSDKDFDLMHFDFKPGGAMAYWTWQDGGKLTAAGAEAVPKFGAGYVYANGERYKAPPGQYASLWGRDPLQTQPQDAQSAIASLIAPSGAPAIPDAPTAAMGFAPTIPDAGFSAPPTNPPPMPQPPPQWAQAGGFPIDEMLSGASAQDVLAGGPRLDPRRASPASLPMPLDMGAMRSPADVLAAGPNLNPRNAIGSAPVGPTTAQGVLDMGPNLRPPGPQVDMPTPPSRPDNFVWNGGGAPDAPPTPPTNPRRDPFGFPIDVSRPALANGDGSISTEETTTFDAAEVGLPPEIVTVPTIVNGRRLSDDEAKAAFAAGQNPPVQRGFANYADAEAAAQARTDAIPDARAASPGPFVSSFPARPEGPAAGMPAASRTGDLSAAMGGPPAPPAPALRTDGGQTLYGPGNAASHSRFDTHQAMQDMAAREAQMASDQESRFLASDLGFQRKQMERYVPDYRAPTPQTMGERFDTAAPMPNAEQMFGLPPMNGASFPAPPPVIGTAEAGSTTGEWFTPAPPMPTQPPDPMAARFNDAFSPGGPGMIADLQGAYNAQQGRPQPGMTAQDGINQVFGAPPAPAAVPNLAIPFSEVPGAPQASAPSSLPTISRQQFDGRFGAPPAPPPSISQQQFDERFAGGTVVPSPPKPGQPGVVSGEMPTPEGAMDIRSTAQGGPGLPPAPVGLPAPSPAQPPRQPNPGAERQRNGIIGRVLGGLLGGPIGALGGGLLGGGFGGAQTFTPYGNPIMNTGMGSFRTSGTAPYGTNGSTNWKSGQSNALGGSNALQWTGSKGQTITAVTDPWTGQTYTSYGL